MVALHFLKNVRFQEIYFVWIWNFILLTGMTKATGPAKLQMNVSEISIQQLKFHGMLKNMGLHHNIDFIWKKTYFTNYHVMIASI